LLEDPEKQTEWPKAKMQACKKSPDLCAVRNAIQLVQRKIRLGHDMDMPLTIYVDKNGAIKYLTAKKVAEVFRKAARKAHPGLLNEEYSKISVHSLRIWACVLLDEEAGQKAGTIKQRLRWVSESYRVYLRDTTKTSKQHLAVLDEAMASVLALLEASPEDVCPSVTPEDLTMGNYQDND